MESFKKFENKRLCAAVSGGVESTALLHYLKAREARDGFLLCAVHCEHGIRGEESVGDWKFVEKLCEEWKIPFYVFREDCPKRAREQKQSLETAAREFRRAAFARLVEENKADYIVTAHHLGDEAETVLFRLARGTALTGAAGMREESGYFLKPFLQKSKREIFAYARENGLVWREDATNLQTDVTRNKLRQTVLPLLEEAVPGAGENLARFAQLAAEDDEWLYAQARKLLQETDGEYLVAFSSVRPLFTRACLLAMKGLGLEKDYTRAHLESAFALQNSERGAKLHFPRGVVAERMQAGVRFILKSENTDEDCPRASEKPFDLDGFDGGRYLVNVFSTPQAEQSESKVLRIDKEKIPEDAVFRFRREGDFIEKFGGGKKTLKKFFNEKKIPVEERAYLPLLASAESGEVYAVCGEEIAEKLKVTEQTRKTVYLVTKRK